MSDVLLPIAREYLRLRALAQCQCLEYSVPDRVEVSVGLAHLNGHLAALLIREESRV